MLLPFPFYKCVNRGMGIWNNLPQTQSPNLWLNQDSHLSLWLLNSLSFSHAQRQARSVNVYTNIIQPYFNLLPVSESGGGGRRGTGGEGEGSDEGAQWGRQQSCRHLCIQRKPVKSDTITSSSKRKDGYANEGMHSSELQRDLRIPFLRMISRVSVA